MSTEAKVGVFVVVSLLVLGATAYFVRTTQSVRGQVVYTTYFRYAGGIAPGTPVLFGGIRVGQVTAVRPAPADPTQIEVLFAVRPGTPVNEQCTVRVGSVSLMSSPALFVTTGSNAARRLNAGEVMRSQEAVSQDEIARRIANLAGTANDLLLDLRRELPPLAADARAVLANLNQITGPRNQKQIEGVLAELNTILQRESPKIAQITDRVAKLAEHADAVVVSAGPLLSNLDATVTNANATLDAIREPLTKDLAELEKVLQDARALLASVQEVVRGNDADIAETVRALHAAAENLRAFTEILKQRPWNLIRTAQPPDRRVPR
ncbi:MAG TPA: MlaD family protein [Vicinamibacterales bacterium]|nr:MlaD family protein [Vicinamibacterales bacterium]